MTSAFRGTYSDLRFIKGRKVAQVVIEVPIEQGSRVVEVFGAPNPAEEVWVGFARLKDNAGPAPTPKRSPAVKQAGIVCYEPEFWAFLRSSGYDVHDEQGAARFVRKWVGVTSRADIAPGSDAERRWNKLFLDYGAWRARYGAGAIPEENKS